ncbi:unnamed protein product [Colias eurytheme]|nr:unnamed protein product [Colias eurytheme]
MISNTKVIYISRPPRSSSRHLLVHTRVQEELDRQIQLELKYFLLFPLGTIQKVLTLYAEHEQYKGRSQ